MDYEVVFTSQTGNTEKVAMKIFEALPGKSKDIQRIEEVKEIESDLYFVGFWNYKGTCSSDIMDFLTELHGKKVALFGTCGLGGSQSYYDRVANQVAAFIAEDNEYMGSFLCAGKMPSQVLEKYKRMQQKQDSPEIRAIISSYEEAMLHPNEEDLRAARQFAEKILGQ